MSRCSVALAKLFPVLARSYWPANQDLAATMEAMGQILPIIVYDGACPFCRKQVARIKDWAPQGTFEYAPRQQEGLENRFPALAQEDFNTGMRLIDPQGKIAVGADAVYEISRRLPVTRWAAWLYKVPGIHQIARAAYDWIARNRYRLAGKQCDDNVCAR